MNNALQIVGVGFNVHAYVESCVDWSTKFDATLVQDLNI